MKLNQTKEAVMKYGLVALFLGVFLLNVREVISDNVMYISLGLILLLIAYLILVKKIYILSTLVPRQRKNDSDYQQKLGRLTGIISLAIALVLFILGVVTG